MTTTDPERAAKIAKLRELLADLDRSEAELLEDLKRCRRHRDSTVRALAALGDKSKVPW